MARKKKRNPSHELTERINLRVTTGEYELVEEARQKDDRSLSNWARRALVKEAKRRTGRNV